MTDVSNVGASHARDQWLVRPRALDEAGEIGAEEGQIVTANDLRMLAAMVFHAPFVQTNPLYAQFADTTAFVPLMEEPVVNAFAAHQPLEINGKGVDPPLIVVMGGVVTAAALAAACHAEDSINPRRVEGCRLAEAFELIGEIIVSSGGCISQEDAEMVSEHVLSERGEENAHATRLARSVAAGTLVGIIAHELGHIALGHTLGEQSSYEVSRNQERQADSFASCVTDQCPFSDHLVTGQILWWTILVWVEYAAGGGDATTHPSSLERLLNCVRDNKATAESLGLTPVTIGRFLPDAVAEENRAVRSIVESGVFS